MHLIYRCMCFLVSIPDRIGGPRDPDAHGPKLRRQSGIESVYVGGTRFNISLARTASPRQRPRSATAGLPPAKSAHPSMTCELQPRCGGFGVIAPLPSLQLQPNNTHHPSVVSLGLASPQLPSSSEVLLFHRLLLLPLHHLKLLLFTPRPLALRHLVALPRQAGAACRCEA